MPRLNPFAFPSDTTFRFALLIAAVVGATLYVWNWIWVVVGADTDEVNASARACLAISEQGLEASSTFSGCVRDTYAESTWWMLGGVALVFITALLVFLAWPLLIERRSRLRPLDPQDAPDAVATLRELSAEAGVSTEPQWLWNPLRLDGTGTAFGYPGRYRVALTGGLIVLHARDPEAFRAVVRHELAHIRNRDVAVTYATLAFWYAFLIAAVLPFAITLLNERGVALSVAWRLVVLAALVYLTRNAVLRSREIYADVRASVTDGQDGALARVVASLPQAQQGFVDRLRALHPAPGERAAALRDPQPLFRLGPIAAFAAGLAATINFDSVHSLLAWWIDEPWWVAVLASLVFAPLVIGVVGVALWRSQFAALARDTPAPPVWVLALALTAGLLVGPELSLARAVVPEERGLLRDLLGGKGVGWILALAALVLLLLVWVERGASVWLRALAGTSPRYALTAGTLVASATLALLLGAYFTLRELSPAISYSRSLTALDHAQISAVTDAGPRWLWQLIMDPLTILLIDRLWIPVAIVLLWAFPLAAAFVRRPRPTEAPWAFLDAPARFEPPAPRIRIHRPLLVGAAAGAACLVVFLVYRGAIHASVSMVTRGQDEFVLAFVFWQVAIAIGFQAAAASVAAALAEGDFRLPEALCAATVAGTIATLGIVYGPAVGGCIDALSIRPGPCDWSVSGDFTLSLWKQVVSQGSVAAVVAAGIVLTVRSGIERARQPRVSRRSA